MFYQAALLGSRFPGLLPLGFPVDDAKSSQMVVGQKRHLKTPVWQRGGKTRSVVPKEVSF